MNINYTFIIPHFDIPNLLQRCIDSIPERADVQIIVVDDQSPNFESYRQLYPSLFLRDIEYYSTSQSGSAGRARNLGLEHAKGKWLVFADADDFFSDEIDLYMNEYVDSEYDLILFNYKSVMTNDISKQSERDSEIRSVLFNESTTEQVYRFCYPMVWGKFIRRELVSENHVKFDEIRWSNDYYFSAYLGCVAKKLLPVNKVLYIVTEREGSLVSNFCKTEDEMICRADVGFRVQELINRYGYDVPRLPVTIQCLMLFLDYPHLFRKYWRRLDEMKVSKHRVINEMCQFCGLKDRLLIHVKLWLNLY